MTTTDPAVPPADAPVDQVRKIDCSEGRPDPGACPLGLPHRVGDAGCKAFRRAVRAKGLNPPRVGWACQPDPATAPTGGSTTGRV